ncbi:MAG: PfkB family carbohydrate kinase [Verrucomicrobiota bacterium]
MSVLVAGTTALDSIKTPKAENPRLLGGSASHAAVAASFFSPVRLVGIVGDDFPKRYIALYRKHGICLEGLDSAPGQTFHWAGEYEVNMNRRQTLNTVLGVIEGYQPTLPESYRNTPYLLLANIAPVLQLHILGQMRRPRFVIADSMDLWMNIALKDLLKLLRKVDAFVLNDTEAHQLAETDNVIAALKRIHKLGPRYVIIKKGEHGSILSGPSGLFVAPAYPLDRVVDPTGAGDSFVGGMIGFLATAKGGLEGNLRKAMVYGSVVASFCCEGFGLARTTRITREQIDQRFQQLASLTRF